jgi:hypothetical protein
MINSGEFKIDQVRCCILKREDVMNASLSCTFKNTQGLQELRRIYVKGGRAWVSLFTDG